MPIMISIPDDCKPLADAVEQLVASTQRARHRASGGRAVDYGHVERDIGEQVAGVERATHQCILAALDVDAPQVLIDGRVLDESRAAVPGATVTAKNVATGLTRTAAVSATGSSRSSPASQVPAIDRKLRLITSGGIRPPPPALRSVR